MSDQSLDSIVQVTVTVSPTLASAPNFNVGLIVGSSTIISPSERVKLYRSLEEMTSDGWIGSEAEYLAAQVYFAQSPRPTMLAVGRQDETVPETPVQAVTACRMANGEWYACFVTGVLTDAEIQAVAMYIESAATSSVYFYGTSNNDILTATAPNIMDTLKSAKLKRTFGQWGVDPFGSVAAMGYAMGANTGLANSSFTMAYKSEVGIDPDDLTTTQLTNILNYNGNAYTGYGGKYQLLVQGTMADGTHFDEVINLDMLVAEIQIAAMNLLVSSPKIPQTESGMSQLIQAITVPCEDALTRGAIGPGVWTAAPILGLQTGDGLPNGYLIQAESLATQSQADREARKSPPIYIAVKMAGAIEFVVIGVIVNR
ncbi:Protein of unknown function [Paenibacillus algorifonticola]|uniref:Phage tail sheath protein n=1 Tax=Paenibacillus algorifonticola TaxID=684063 RepID=A0A1I2AHJ2_9BACL|nr:DUF3383 family protein [Paenibacillus algorifonticola]SFE43504.1 Protein of unknown function [Paenibacillus algorifonticola]